MNTVDALLNWRLDIFWDALKHLLLPVLTLAYVNWALILRVMRSSMLEVVQPGLRQRRPGQGLCRTQVIRRGMPGRMR